jgi:hypothetical protein
VLSGAEAVARTERILVGDALARAPAVAEGLVLAGVRAASVAGRVDSSPSGDLPAGVSCVHHVTAAPGSASGGSFELAATSAQEAVDDCIAAHLLSQRLGRPGSCSLAPNLADDLAVVQLPDASASEKRLADAALSQQSTVDPDSITELACEALMSAGGSSELPAAPVVSDGDAGADLVLVAAGESAAAARAATRALAEAGVRTRAAIVRLMRPFPADLLRQALAGARMIVAVDAPGEPLQGFIAAVRAASGAEAEVRGVVAKGSTSRSWRRPRIRRSPTAWWSHPTTTGARRRRGVHSRCWQPRELCASAAVSGVTATRRSSRGTAAQSGSGREIC